MGGVIAVSVIVPAFNAERTVGATLDALLRQDIDEPYEVIVVDDGSEDLTAQIAEAAGERVLVLRQDRGGPGPARNLGASRARGDVLAFTDADCVPTPGWLREGLAALAGADLVQGAVRPDPGAERRPFDRTVAVGRDGALYEAASLFVRRDLYERLSGFEDWLGARIGKPLAEDVWFGWRARREGARTAFREGALVHHAVLRRGAGEYVAERLRLAYFPAIAAKIPELREGFFHRRVFLSPRCAAFDAAALGAALGVGAWVAGAGPASLVALAAAVPYARLSARAVLPWGRRAPKVALVDLAADAVGMAALAWGSVRHRSPLF
jgi:glycosyltransferase involved in cell wall biosynthesis